MKKLLAILMVALLVLPTAAFAEGITGEVSLIWWGGESRTEKTLTVIDMFNAAYPGITASGRVSGDYWGEVTPMLSAGTSPDILQFGGNYPDYAAKGQLLPLNDYLGTIIDTTNFDQAMIDAATMDGNVYGMCLGANRIGIVYNKSLLESVGAPMPGIDYTWETFGDYLAEVQSKLPEGVYAIYDAPAYETNTFGYYARSFGQTMWNGEESTLTLDTVDNYINMWAEWRDAGYLPPAEISAEYAEENAETSALVAGKIAMIMLYSNMTVGYQAAMTDEIAITTLPAVDTNAAWVMPSQYFCIAANSANPEAAATFVNFFVNTPDVGKVLLTDRGIPSNSEVRAAIAESATPIEQSVYALFDVLGDHSSAMDPNVPNDQEFNDGWAEINLAVSYGLKTPAEAAQECFDLLNAMIAKGL